MNVFELTRALVDNESITGNEEQVGLFLLDYLGAIASRYRGRVERMEVERLRAISTSGRWSLFPRTWIRRRRSFRRARRMVM